MNSAEWEHSDKMRRDLVEFLNKFARTLEHIGTDAPTRVFWSHDMATMVDIAEESPEIPYTTSVVYTTCGRDGTNSLPLFGMRVMNCRAHTPPLCSLRSFCPVCGQTYAAALPVFHALRDAFRLWVDYSKPIVETRLRPGEGVSIHVDENNEMLLLFADLVMGAITPLVHPLHTIMDDTPAHLGRPMEIFRVESLPFGYDGGVARYDQCAGTPVQLWLKGPERHRVTLYRPDDATGDGVIYGLFARHPGFTLQRVPAEDALKSVAPPVSNLAHIPTELLANRPSEPLHMKLAENSHAYYEFIHLENGHVVHPTLIHADSTHKRLIVRVLETPTFVRDYTLRVLAMPNAEQTTLPVLAYDTIEKTLIDDEMITTRPDVNPICQGWSLNVSLDQLRACLSEEGDDPNAMLLVPADLTLDDLTLDPNPI